MKPIWNSDVESDGFAQFAEMILQNLDKKVSSRRLFGESTVDKLLMPLYS